MQLPDIDAWKEIAVVVAVVCLVIGIVFSPSTEATVGMVGALTALITQRVAVLNNTKTADRAAKKAAEDTFRRLSASPADAPPEARELVREAKRVPMPSSTGFSDVPPVDVDLVEENLPPPPPQRGPRR